MPRSEREKGTLLRSLERLVRTGASPDLDARRRRRVVVDNAIALALALNTSVYVVALYALGLRSLALLLLPVAGVHLSTIWLNHLGRFGASRLTLVTVANLTVFVYIFLIGLRGETSLFFAAVCIPLVVCELEQMGIISPDELSLQSLPAAIVSSDRHYALEYRRDVESVRPLDGLMVVMTEVTADIERKRAEEIQVTLQVELAQAQKLESVGRLAAGIAHEINTPIQYVGDSVHFVRESIEELNGLVEQYRDLGRSVAAGAAIPADAERMLQVEEEADFAYLRENMPKALDRAAEGLSRVAAIVRSMKDFAHPDDAEKAPADLNLALRSTITVATSAFKSVADVETDLGDIPPVRCFLGSLNQVFLNLIVNAADAIEEAVSGSVRRGRITIRTRQQGPSVVITIGDDGAGIPEALKARLFEQFFTTKPVGKGTGQGLAIAQRIVKSHGGTIWFESAVGEGTTFFIQLPVEPPEASPS